MPKRETLTVERVPFQFQLDKNSDFESGRFSGIASVFDSIVDTFPNRTRIKKGAFLRTINSRGNRVKILMAHDQGSIWIGLPTKLQETEEGLLIEGSLNNTALGKDAAEALRHAASLGRLEAAEMSIGFDALNFEMVEDEETEELFRDITELRLWEVSLVAFGADRQTKITEVASRDMERQLVPKHREEALALAIQQNVDSLVEIYDSPEHSEPSATTAQLVEGAHSSLTRWREKTATGSANKPPTAGEPTNEQLEVELIEAEMLCLALFGS